jgi:hypothetical protein
MKNTNFFAELKQRNVYKVAVAYSIDNIVGMSYIYVACVTQLPFVFQRAWPTGSSKSPVAPVFRRARLSASSWSECVVVTKVQRNSCGWPVLCAAAHVISPPRKVLRDKC